MCTETFLLEAINRSELFVANQDGNIVGFVEYRHRRDEQTTLYNIVVVGDYRRKGIGEKLVEALIEEAKALNKSFILLKCPEELCANKFYETLNFHLEETEEGKNDN
ncbi:MAG: GNAT family N-acetyltransferase [Anaerolineales bacterium]|nr:GNAT family N-acetyltransferase [Anaerolineales bacterium]